MRTKRSIKWGSVAAAAACVAVVAMPGCELLVDFDRSKIAQEGGLVDGTTLSDSPSTGDGTNGESGPENETSTGDDGGDAAADSPTTDSPLDGSETATGVDTGVDAPAESGSDSSASDSGVDEAGD